MYERDRATFAQNCLKVNALPIYSREQTIDTFNVGEALLLCQNKWGKGDKWPNIINGYIQLIKNQGNHVSNAVVALGSYKSSKKDHTYWYLEKHFFHEIKITHCIRQRNCLFLNIVIKLNLFLN